VILAGCLSLLLQLPEHAATPILASAIAIADAMPATRLDHHAHLLMLAAWFGWGELVQPILVGLRSRIRSFELALIPPERVETGQMTTRHDTPVDLLANAFVASLRALRSLRMHEEAASLVADTTRLIADHGTTNEPFHSHMRIGLVKVEMLLAGAQEYAGDRRARAYLERTHDQIRSMPLVLTAHLDATRALACAYSLTSVDVALERIPQLSTLFREITDSFGTNSHFCLSVLHFVESLVHGITDIADDPRAQATAACS
jgi:hypothetical protein